MFAVPSLAVVVVGRGNMVPHDSGMKVERPNIEGQNVSGDAMASFDILHG